MGGWTPFLCLQGLDGFGTAISVGVCSLHPPGIHSTSLGSSCLWAPGLGMTLQQAGPWVDAMPCQSLFPLGSFPALCMPSLPRRCEEESREQGPPALPVSWHFPFLGAPSTAQQLSPGHALQHSDLLLTHTPAPPVYLLLLFPHPAAQVSGSTHTLPRVRGQVPVMRLRRLKGKLDG